VDAVKLRSSMTLFAAAAAAAAADDAEADDAETDEADRAGTAARAGGGGALGKPDGNVFRAVLAKYFGGAADEETLARLLGPADPASRRAGIKENP
jgi:uncharacterized protein (DUF1810 family)